LISAEVRKVLSSEDVAASITSALIEKASEDWRIYGFWIELKRPGTRNVDKALSKEQRDMHVLLRDRGYEIYTLADLDTVLGVLKDEGVLK
jgi:hypothetical protein